jgi:tRNA modification GTPase
MTDTIVALATPRGEGAIAIVRLSGPAAHDVLERLFKRKNNAAHPRNGHLAYGHIVRPDNNAIIDEVLAVRWRAPRTYTCEDMAEVHCHGGWLAARTVLELALASGARLAGPGEFTRRAFLNGRIDLGQAAAVAALIQAQSETALAAAARQLDGALRHDTGELQEALVDLAARAEAALNFPDDVAQRLPTDQWQQAAEHCLQIVERLTAQARQGELAQEGVKVAIVGAPNAGKSTVFNALLARERAIVSDVPGTTRDALEERAIIRGRLVALADTAGLAVAGSPLEEAMAAKTREYLARADIILLVADAGMAAPPLPDLTPAARQRLLVAANKSDRLNPAGRQAIAARFTEHTVVDIAALTGAGLDELKNHLARLTDDGLAGSAPAIHLALEQQTALADVRTSLAALAGCIGGQLPEELWAEHVHQALRHLEEFNGAHLAENVLDRIFARFCIGK